MAPRKELAGEARLADSRVRKQQDDAELPGGGVLKLPPEFCQLGTSAHQLGCPSHSRNYPPGSASELCAPRDSRWLAPLTGHEAAPNESSPVPKTCPQIAK